VPVALVAVATAVVTSGYVFVSTHDSKVRGNTQYTIGTVAKATVKRTVSASGTLDASELLSEPAQLFARGR
jgi:hypothetical protein